MSHRLDAPRRPLLRIATPPRAEVRRGTRNARRPCVEPMEDRTLLSALPDLPPMTFAVTSTTDDGPGSLRRAILDANANPGATIVFNIPTNDPNFVDVDSHLVGGDPDPDAFVIRLSTALPALTGGGITIDGRSQTAFTGDTNPFGPEVVLDGSAVPPSVDGLLIQSANNRVFGLNVQGFTRNGIRINGSTASNNWIAGNSIGTNATGTAAASNGNHGVNIFGGASRNIIGTNGDGVSDEAERNVISGNGIRGVQISGSGTDHNVVAGNFIGTDVAGAAPLGNSAHGVQISGGARRNRIGTDGDGVADAAERNVISGNGAGGVLITDTGTDENVVAGNYIGTNAAGTAALGNAQRGVAIIWGAQRNRIGTDADGTADAAERNVISGNAWAGIFLWAPAGHATARSDHNLVAGNFIGTDAAGTAAIANRGDAGVVIAGNASSNVVGTPGLDGPHEAARRNAIAGNQGFAGILVDNAHQNVIAGNFIGVDRTGRAALGNRGSGIEVKAGASGNRIGTDGDGVADAAERNVIAGNTGSGILFWGAATSGNIVAGNFIGTNAEGTAVLPNNIDGVQVQSPANRIGGAGVLGNLISGNRLAGVRLPGADARSNRVQGNRIGTNAAGTAAIPNGIWGIRLDQNARDNLIGADGDEAEGNLISGNGDHGVSIIGASSSGNRIAGNLIGTDASGNAPLGNTWRGIDIESPGNIVGGLAPWARNVIAANRRDGVRIAGASASGNVVIGNLIGVGADGTTALGNVDHGVLLGGNNQVVGGADPGLGNTIAFNGRAGVVVVSGSGHTIRGNSIHSNVGLGIDLGNDGVTPNDPLDADTGPNQFQNFPVIEHAGSDSTATTIRGTLHSRPGTTFLVELFSNPTGAQGRTWLGVVEVTTDDDGNASFTFTPTAAVPVGHTITATATDPLGNTSEFSAALAVSEAPDDVTDRVAFQYGGFFYNRRTQRFTQSITITNTGSAPIIGPVSLVLDDLTPGVTLVNRTGITRRVGQLDSPYIDILPSSSTSLAPGQGLTVTLEFANPSNLLIRYTARVLAGSGER